MMFEEITHEQGGLRITLYRKGEPLYQKSRHPSQYGIYSEVEDPHGLYRFNLNHELIRMQEKGNRWPDPREWLKRTDGNDWIYYASGGYSGAFEEVGKGVLPKPISFRVPSPYSEIYKATGEYYLPNFQYSSNTISSEDPFQRPAVAHLLANWYPRLKASLEDAGPLPEPFRSFAEKVLETTPESLQQRSQHLFQTAGFRPSVLPPDTRHVDYQLIPLDIAEGCRYQCGFCEVKSRQPFCTHSLQKISQTIEDLKEFYGEDLINYNALFLGDHDALNADEETLIQSTEKAVAELGLSHSYMKGSCLFLFGSVDSFLRCSDALLEALEKTGCRVYINLGLESAHQATLDWLKKPVQASRVIECFEKMLEVNEHYQQIEVTGNFLLGDDLPPEHYDAFLQLARESVPHPMNKGTFYFSPLIASGKPSRHLLYYFNQLKRMSRLPVYLYNIQRL